jgi:hypothetical protein
MQKFKPAAGTLPGLNEVYNVANLSNSDGILAAVHQLEQLAPSKKAFVSELRQLAQAPGILALIFSSGYIILRVDLRVGSSVTKTTTKGCMSTWSAKCWTCFPLIATCTFLATLRPTSPHSPRISSLLFPATSPHSHHQAELTHTSIRNTTISFRASTWQSRPSSLSLNRIKHRAVSRGMPLVKLAMSSRSSIQNSKRRRKRS